MSLEPHELSIQMVEGCFQISPDPSFVEESIHSVVSDVPFDLENEVKERLGQSIANVVEFLRVNESENKRTWVYLHDPGSGRIDAIVTMEFLTVGPGDLTKYKETVFAKVSSDADDDSVNRNLSFREVAAGEAIVISDVLVPPVETSGALPAMERAIVAVFLHGESVMVEIAVLTQDLALFEDIGEFATTIAGTIKWSPGRSAQ